MFYIYLMPYGIAKYRHAIVRLLATKTTRAVRIFTGCQNDALYVGSGQRSADDLLRRTSRPVFAVYISRKTTMIISCSMTVGLQVS